MQFDEDYSISGPLTGDSYIKKLVLTGWSNAPTKMEAGRVYWSKTTGDVLDIYTLEAKASGDKICTGTITSNVVTLVQANTSGISGTAYVAHTSGTASTGNIIVTYAVEDDLKIELSNVVSLLDGSSTWEGGTRFETALKASKRELDQMILGQLAAQNRVPYNASGKPDLTILAEPGQFRRVHAKLCAALLLSNRAVYDSSMLDMSAAKREEAIALLRQMQIAIDVGNDDLLEAPVNASAIRLSR